MRIELSRRSFLAGLAATGSLVALPVYLAGEANNIPNLIGWRMMLMAGNIPMSEAKSVTMWTDGERIVFDAVQWLVHRTGVVDSVKIWRSDNMWIQVPLDRQAHLVSGMDVSLEGTIHA